VRIPAASAEVTALGWHPNGRHLVAGHADGALRIYDCEDGRCTRAVAQHTRAVRARLLQLVLLAVVVLVVLVLVLLLLVLPFLLLPLTSSGQVSCLHWVPEPELDAEPPYADRAPRLFPPVTLLYIWIPPPSPRVC